MRLGNVGWSVQKRQKGEKGEKGQKGETSTRSPSPKQCRGKLLTRGLAAFTTGTWAWNACQSKDTQGNKSYTQTPS